MTDDAISGEPTPRSARYSDPINQRGGWIGPGAVLYDTRKPEYRTCCAREDCRHLYHITAVYEEIVSGNCLVELWDGTHTVREYHPVHDVLGMFEPAGFSINPGTKPTYVLTRQHGVDDPHDLMTRGEKA